MKKVEERTNLDLLELTLQLHSRAVSQPHNKEMHDASVEARQELEKRLQVNNNAVLPHVSKRYEYKFKAMPPQGGYVIDIVEADSREEAKEILSKKYNEICWISSRL